MKRALKIAGRVVLVLAVITAIYFIVIAPYMATASCNQWAVDKMKGMEFDGIINDPKYLLPIVPKASSEELDRMNTAYELYYRACKRGMGYETD